jgi:hypothetical protein
VTRPRLGKARREAPPALALGERWSWLPPLALLAWLALVVTLLLHHEPWRDEADTWLAARDLSPAGLWRFAGYVGSPTLWYWLQMPLAKLGAPYASLGFLNACFAAIGIALFLWRAPFAWWIRLLFAFSYFGSYEYAVIARSYALGMALLFGLAAMHGSRLVRPLLYGALVALLVNTSVHGAILGTAILATFAWDVWRAARAVTEGAATAAPGARMAGLALGISGLVLAIVQLAPPPDGQLAGIAEWIDWSTISSTLAGALFPTAENSPLAAVAGWIVWIAAVIALVRSPRALFALVASSIGLWLLFLLKYRGELRHWGFLLLAMLYALWIASDRAIASPDDEKARDGAPAESKLAGAGRGIAFVGLSAALAWSTYVATDFWRRDFARPFSASRAVARYLIERGLVAAPIAAFPSANCESVLPYLPGVRFYDPGTREYGTHMRWDRDGVAGWNLTEPDVLARVKEAFPSGQVTLLTNQPMRLAEREGFRLEHAEVGDVMMGDEQYFVYRRTPGRNAAPR